MKVTDRRMFTPEGELRQEYRHLEDVEATAEPPAAAQAEEPAPSREEPEPPAGEPSADEPSILELVRLLAENASIHLQRAEMPNGQVSENLDVAKLYIDLLAVLKKKTDGNLTMREDTVLEDVLYQLRLGYAERRGF